MHHARRSVRTATILCFILVLHGCLSDAETAGSNAESTYSDAEISRSGVETTITSAKTDSTTLAKSSTSGAKRRVKNTAPTISGTPLGSVLQDTSYRFVPMASDVDGDLLTFSIANQPEWASFDRASGALTGRPGAADVAIYSNIVMSVSDGKASAQLSAFSVAVEAYSLGSATLSWLPPTENVDDSPLLDLAGYRIYWGRESGNYASSVEIMNPAITTFVVENLSSGTQYFAMTALNKNGLESALSEEAIATIP
jgi:hypothetical protein